jgi:hypothetical protein
MQCARLPPGFRFFKGIDFQLLRIAQFFDFLILFFYNAFVYLDQPPKGLTGDYWRKAKSK